MVLVLHFLSSFLLSARTYLVHTLFYEEIGERRVSSMKLRKWGWCQCLSERMNRGMLRALKIEAEQNPNLSISCEGRHT